MLLEEKNKKSLEKKMLLETVVTNINIRYNALQKNI